MSPSPSARRLVQLVTAGVTALALLPVLSTPSSAAVSRPPTYEDLTRIAGPGSVTGSAVSTATDDYVAMRDGTSVSVHVRHDHDPAHSVTRRVAGAGAVDSVAVAASGARAVVAWNDGGHLLWSVSEDRGETWDTAQRFDVPLAAYATEPQVAVDGATVAITWQQVEDEGVVRRTYQHVATSVDAGASFTIKKLAEVDWGRPWYDVAVRGSEVAVTWLSPARLTGSPRTFVSTSADRGVTWGADVRLGGLADGGLAGTTDLVTTPSGFAALVPQSMPSGPTTYWVSVGRAGGTWTHQQVVGAGCSSCTVRSALAAEPGTGRLHAVMATDAGLVEASEIEGGGALSFTLSTVAGWSEVSGAWDLGIAAGASGEAVVMTRYLPKDTATSLTTAGVTVASRRYGSTWALDTTGRSDLLVRRPVVLDSGPHAFLVAMESSTRRTSFEPAEVVTRSFLPGDHELTLLDARLIQASAATDVLVDGKQTVLRARIRSTLAASTSVALRWTVDTAGEDGTTRRVVTDTVRRLLKPGITTLHLHAPAGLVPHGAAHLEVALDPADEVAEPDETDNTAQRDQPVRTTRRMPILMVPVTGPGVTPVSCTQLQLFSARTKPYLRQSLPVSDSSTISYDCAIGMRYTPFVVPAPVPSRVMISTMGWQKSLLLDPRMMVVAVAPPGFFAEHSLDLPHAIGAAGTKGYGVSVVELGADGGWPAAHEISHDLGWVAADAPGNTTGEDGGHMADVPAPGYATDDRRAVDEIDWMHPAANGDQSRPARWISGATWEHLVDKLAEPAAAALAADQPVLQLSGGVGEDGTVELAPVEESAGTPTSGSGGDVVVRSLSATGEELARTTLRSGRVEGLTATGEDVSVGRPFAGTVPLVAGTRALAVSAGGATTTVRRTASAPTVTLTGSTPDVVEPGEDLTVTYAAADADGDAVQARLELAVDDGPWRPAAANATAGTATLAVPASLGDHTLRLRVVATDGWQTGASAVRTVRASSPRVEGPYLVAQIKGSSNGVPNELWSARQDGTDQQKVLSLPNAGGVPRDLTGLAQSSTGDRVAFAADGSELWTADPDGSHAIPVGAAAALAKVFPRGHLQTRCPRFSPDGTRLAFFGAGEASDGHFDNGVYTIGLDGSGLRTVVQRPTPLVNSETCLMDWAPEGIVLEDQSMPDGYVAVFPLDGSAPRRLVSFPAPPAGRYNVISSLDVSPDGSRLVLLKADYTASGYPMSALTFRTSDGSATGAVRTPATTGPAKHLAWTATGTGFTFTTRWGPGEVSTLHRYDAATSTWTKLLEEQTYVDSALRVMGPKVPVDRDTPPRLVASIASPPAVVEGTAVTLDASGSTAAAGGAAYAWDTDSDGAFDDATGPKPSVTLPDQGAWPVAVQVTDSTGRADVASRQVRVSNAVPQAAGVVAGLSGGLGTVDLVVTDRGVADEPTVTMTWPTGVVTQATVSPTATPGRWAVAGAAPTYQGQVTVRLDDGDGASVVLPKVNLPAPPDGQAPVGQDADVTVHAGEAVTVTPLGSDPDGDPLRVYVAMPAEHGEVTVVDGVGPLGEPGITYRPEDGYLGEDRVTVSVRDVVGNEAEAVVTLHVVPPPVEPGVPVTASTDGPWTGTEGSATTLTGSVTGPAGTTAAWTVAPGAGVDVGARCVVTDPTAAQTSVSCDDDGTWTLTLTATAPDGVSRSSQGTLTVGNATPVVSVDRPSEGASVPVGSALTAAATVSDPGANDRTTCRVDWGDGATGECGTSHAWSSAGSRLVVVTATDDDGASSTVTRQVIVTPTSSVWPWAGFFAPVDNLPVVNTVKAGSAVPVSFSLGGDRGLDVLDGAPVVATHSCSSTAPTDQVEETVTANASGLTYSSATGRYTYVLKTAKTWAGTCKRFTLRLKDGTSHSAELGLR